MRTFFVLTCAREGTHANRHEVKGDKVEIVDGCLVVWKIGTGVPVKIYAKNFWRDFTYAEVE